MGLTRGTVYVVRMLRADGAWMVFRTTDKQEAKSFAFLLGTDIETL